MGFNVVYVTMIHSQAMEEHHVRQARIVEALEAEKKKISKELEEMQKKREFRKNQTPQNGKSIQITTEHILKSGITMTFYNLLVEFQMGGVHPLMQGRHIRVESVCQDLMQHWTHHQCNRTREGGREATEHISLHPLLGGVVR